MKTLNRDIISFDEAKKLSLKKWNTIKTKIGNILNSLADDCGFCERNDLLYPNYDYRECKNCEAKNLCINDIFPIDNGLIEAYEWTKHLINNIEALKEKKQ